MKQRFWKQWMKRRTALAAAVILSASALTIQTTLPIYVFAEEKAAEEKEIFPKEITLDAPMALKDVKIPENKYGTFRWEEEEFVPDQYEQSCKVILKVKDGVDLSKEEGYDSKEHTLKGTIRVIVESLRVPEEEMPEGTEEEITQEEAMDAAAITEAPEELLEETITEENVPEENIPEELQEKSEEETEASSDTREEPSEEPTETPSPAEADPIVMLEEVTPTEVPVVDIFEREQPEEDTRPTQVDRSLGAQEQLQAAQTNHTCNGIMVSGAELPWYVQFRVKSGAEYNFTNEANAAIFKSFDFELWDLIHDKEYTIPDGAYISVSIPVKEGYQYTVEHILKTGATETIIPSVEGNTLEFSAHSFSPFGIAGSIGIVDPIGDNGYVSPSPAPSTAAVKTPTATPTPKVTQKPQSTAGAAVVTATPAPTNVRAVQTGDNTQIIPLIILIAAALVLIVLIVILLILRRR